MLNLFELLLNDAKSKNMDLGAEFYEIDSLSKDNLSAIALLGLKKLGFDIK